MESPSPISETERAAVDQAMVDNAYAQGKAGAVMTGLAVGGVAWAHWLFTASTVSTIWLVPMVLLVLVRGAVTFHVASRLSAYPVGLKRRLFVWPLTATSLLWGALPPLVFPAAGEVERMALAVLLSGMAGGAATVLAALKWPGRFYLFCLLAPASAMLLAGGPNTLVLGVLGLIFLAVMLKAHQTTRQILAEAFLNVEQKRRLAAQAESERLRAENLNSELRAAQQQLLEQNARLEQTVAERTETLRLADVAIQAMGEGVVVLNDRREILDVNPAFCRITGFAQGEVVGRGIDLLADPDEDPGIGREMWRAAEQHGAWSGELRSRTRDGTRFLEQRAVSAVRDAQGRTTNYVMVVTDITAARQSELELDDHRRNLERLVRERTMELATAKEAAEAANVAKSAFLANMSHEIRTPMNGILGMAYLLRREGVSERQARRLDQIDIAAKHLLSVINNILDISKIEAGKLVLDTTQVDVRAIVGNVANLLADGIKEKGLALEVECDPLPGDLLGDATRLQQALLNYAGNAVKFTESGRIGLTVRRDAEGETWLRLRFEVSDTGIGIPEEFVGRLFAAFEQVDGSNTRKYGGTGLGLAITRRLAALMGGEVGVDTRPGRGSRFWFTAVLRKGDATVQLPTPERDQDEGEELRARHAGTRLLVVDDEPVNRDIARLLLEDVGMEVDVAEDGRQAVVMAANRRYGAILMDMQMPVLDGLAATRRIRELPGAADIPVIAVTANVFEGDRARCLAAGMNGVLTKPYDANGLFRSVLEHLPPRQA